MALWAGMVTPSMETAVKSLAVMRFGSGSANRSNQEPV